MHVLAGCRVMIAYSQMRVYDPRGVYRQMLRDEFLDPV